MNPLIKEDVCITQGFGAATFVGAIAVMLHTNEQHQSQDLDFVVAEQISNDEYLEKGYKIDLQKDKKISPRGFKIDVYDKHDFNEMSLEYIIETAAVIPVDKKGTTVNAISLEGLIVSKYRAGRDQDIEDLQRLAIRCNSKINWNEIAKLAKNDVEYSNIKQAIQFYASQ